MNKKSDSSEPEAELLREIIDHLVADRSLYGPVHGLSSLQSDDNEATSDLNAPTTPVRESPPQNREKPAPEQCQSLDELRQLCEISVDLKTDLEDTRLVFGIGNPDADLMLIGEAPGYYEDQLGEPFVGKAGQLLNKILQAIQFNRHDVYIANILKHRPPNNRDPKPEERQRSIPYLKRQIELVNPSLILCLGRVSATTLLGIDEPLTRLRNRFHPFMGRELMVTYHPAALLRNPKWKRPVWEDVQMLKRRYDELQSQ